MDRYKKKELQRMVKTLQKANETISKIDKTNHEQVIDMLSQCQESAISLGTYLDTFGETYSGLVKILEDYCEVVYQMSISLSDSHRCFKLSKKVRKQLADLDSGISGSFPEDRREVVFLPYKASMWDSMESVWKAAEKDEFCNAYVIPIPYFDKGPDGSFQNMHDERDQYPEYVPITSYEEYDFVTRRPDMVIIHNPYDNNNYVTSVAPFFYAKNLKQFTDKLVYIPYFILEEIDPDNEMAVERISHFCTVPAVFHADQVIVQSDQMKKVYIKVLTALMGDTRAVRAYWENKIQGLGSPKTDQILNIKREELPIPKEWLRILKKPDGSLKKIILYNTGIAGFLESGGQIFAKMEMVFSYLKENRREIALLWRPHPLLENTILSMRPQLWERYQSLRDTYLKENWGIYDDSPEWARAIRISDGYFGDISSLVALCKKINKPVMIQDETIRYGEREEDSDQEKLLFFWDFLCDGETAWICPISYNCLIKEDRRQKKGEIVLFFDEEEAEQGLYHQIIPYREYLIFIPGLAKRIAVFHTMSRKLTYVPVTHMESRLPGLRIPGVVRKGSELWLFPWHISQNLSVLNLETWRVEEKPDFLKSLLQLRACNPDQEFGMPAVEDMTAWIPLKQTNCIIEYRLTDGTMFLHSYMEEHIRINSIERYPKGVIMTLTDDTRIIRWNLEDHSQETIFIETEWNRNQIPFSRTVCTGQDSFLVLPAHVESIFHVKGGRIQKMEYPKGFEWVDDYKAGWSRMLYCKVTEESVFIMPAVGNMLLRYDRKTETLEGTRCRISDQTILDELRDRYTTKRLKYLLDTGCYIKETNRYHLEHLLNYVKQYKMEETQAFEETGALIYKSLIQ